MKLGVIGRKNTFKVLQGKLNRGDRTIWFHCASLGEYEQGLPVFEEIKKDFPDHRIVLSFFSPSGFEVKKDSSITDIVVYLPLDTQMYAKTFVDLVQPELVIFVKYEIWPNYLKALQSKGIRTLLISALFRKDQIYFKQHGKLMRRALTTFEHIFVQDQSSHDLLKSIGYHDATISGDTRFDRVSNQLKINNHLQDVERFKNDQLTLVCGSTWPEDESILTEYINSAPNHVKFIIAPHNINEKQIVQLQSRLTKTCVLYSNRNNAGLENADVLIIDSIGLLSKIYSYADIAYVGGAMGTTGLHNTLEPAIFGIPIIIGKNHTKFPEAKRMIAKGGMASISGRNDFTDTMTKLIDDKDFRERMGTNNREFIEENRGAVIQIIDFIRK